MKNSKNLLHKKNKNNFFKWKKGRGKQGKIKGKNKKSKEGEEERQKKKEGKNWQKKLSFFFSKPT
jgi:hypothetical protein